MIHHVFANRSNVGDWLSARGIQALLAPLAVTEHLCDEPWVPATLEALARAAPDDLVVVGGGGLFMDYFTPFWAGFAPLVERLPFCVWGVGVVDLKQEPSLCPREVLEPILARARVCRVRDELTRRYLGGLALAEPVPCPSLVALAPRPPGGRGMLHVANYTTVGGAAYERMRAAAMAFAAATERPFRETSNRIRPDSEADLAATLELYAAADRVLSSRLHGCLLALATGRKVLAVSGDRKLESFMEAAGLGAWVLDLGQLDELPGRLAALDRQPSAEPFLERALGANREVARAVRAALPGVRWSQAG